MHTYEDGAVSDERDEAARTWVRLLSTLTAADVREAAEQRAEMGLPPLPVVLTGEGAR